MSEAFRCDGCRGFYSGSPALELGVQGSIFAQSDGPDLWRPEHKGGRDDYNPIREYDGEKVEWPAGLLQSPSAVFCGNCAVEKLMPAIQVAVHDKEP